jgi:hypothetical protein
MKKRILIGAPVRQDHQTFYKYLKALNQLDTDGVHVDFFFILHNSPRLKRFLKLDQYTEFESENDYKRDEIQHHWSLQNLSDVTIMKNFLIKKAIQDDYSHFFLVDSDLILKPDTLQRLLSHDKAIVSQCFWTSWTPNSEPMPNAWIGDSYSFKYEGQWREWHKEGLYEVGGSGACILIHSQVLHDGVNYSPIKNVSFSNWEDRAFSIRAICAGHSIFMDTTNPPIHLYRPKELKPSKNKMKQAHQTK